MAIKRYNPTSAGRRNAEVNDYAELTQGNAPAKGLLRKGRKTGGRNNQGVTTSRFRGGGNKRRYRVIDFHRTKDDVPATVASIEYDPNRNCHIALLHYADGEKRYILAPVGLKKGSAVISGDKAEPQVGNAMVLWQVPLGYEVHNVELIPGRGGQMCRSAGTVARVSAKEGDHVHLILPSGEVRMVHRRCRATIGQLGNVEYANIRVGKAGKTRHRGRRPHNRGTSMNPVDHPLGGGEGRSGGGRHPCSPTGRLAKGGRTRNRRKSSTRRIVRRRRSVRYGIVSK
ncbi:MAG: 50S ribosomal protein L2 [Phycisphaerae bacterium]|nr:50S ribosomal protein L2 [Phycisphaerae bacterium]